MISYKRFQLKNGLKVLVHEDHSTPLAAVNILYDVGSRDESADKTGFAHLFEHLMFGGSVNIPIYDEPLERAGGENNAFTSNDITNYYLTIPSNNLETAFWLESDRMLSLAFTDKSLEVQRNVVIEEFKERYLNQPYGDVWLLLRPMVYKVHPYQWATIGKEISHIENATLDDVRDFFKKFYCPNNAIMVVAGDVKLDEIKALSEKWFGDIPPGNKNAHGHPEEPVQNEERKLSVDRDVPFDAIYKAYHCCKRMDEKFYPADLLSDILSRGNSSRLYVELIKNKKLFSEIHAHITGDIDLGLLIIEGKLVKGVKMEDAEAAILEELNKLKETPVPEDELQKQKNKIESSKLFSEMSIPDIAMNIAYAELLGDADIINTEIEKYNSVTAKQVQDEANRIFKEKNCSTLYYLAKNNKQ
jgi:zinc protease